MKKTKKMTTAGYIALAVLLLGPQKKSDQPVW